MKDTKSYMGGPSGFFYFVRYHTLPEYANCTAWKMEARNLPHPPFYNALGAFMSFLKTLSRVTLYSFLSAVLALCLTSCGTLPLPTPATTEPAPSKQDVYKLDLQVKINGKDFSGIGVVPQAPAYEIVVYPQDKIDRIIWQTCNREEVVDRPNTGWFNKSYRFSFTPLSPIEDEKACALQITVLTEKTNRVGMALFAFTDKRVEVNVPATVRCNGRSDQYPGGVSVCQSAAGLTQQIEFRDPVINAGVKGACNVMKTDNEKVYTFEMPLDKCTYYFVAQDKASNGKRRVHRLETAGYNFIPVR
jgi:hypothetical protein